MFAVQGEGDKARGAAETQRGGRERDKQNTTEFKTDANKEEDKGKAGRDKQLGCTYANLDSEMTEEE